MKRVKQAIDHLLIDLHPLQLGLKQFTIDWIENLRDESREPLDDVTAETENLAFSYRLDVLIEVMAHGKDREFLVMLQTFTNCFNQSNKQVF